MCVTWFRLYLGNLPGIMMQVCFWESGTTLIDYSSRTTLLSQVSSTSTDNTHTQTHRLKLSSQRSEALVAKGTQFTWTGRKQGLMPVWTHTDTNTAEWLHKLECTCINVSKRKHTHTHTSTTGCSCTRSASTLAAILSAASQINSLNRAVRYCMV